MGGIWCVQVSYRMPYGKEYSEKLLHHIAHTETMSLPGLMSGGSKPFASRSGGPEEWPEMRYYTNRLFFEDYTWALQGAFRIEKIVEREGGQVLRMEVFPGDSIYDPFPIIFNPARNPMRAFLHVRFQAPSPAVGQNTVEEIISSTRPDYAEHGTMGPVRMGDQDVMYFFAALRFDEIFRASRAERIVEEVLTRRGLWTDDTWVSMAPTTMRYRVAENKMKVRMVGGKPVPVKPAAPPGAYVTKVKVESPEQLFDAIIRARMIAEMATFMHEVHFTAKMGLPMAEAIRLAGPAPPAALKSAERLAETVERLNKTSLVDLFRRAVKAVKHTGEVYAPRHFAVFLTGFAMGAFEPGFSLKGFDFQIPNWKYPETAPNPMYTAVIGRDRVRPGVFRMGTDVIRAYFEWSSLPPASRELEMAHPRWMPIRMLADLFRRIGVKTEGL